MSPTEIAMTGAIAETKSYLKGLDDFYRREIEPWLRSREAERAAAIRRRWWIIGGGLGGSAILAIALWLAQLHPLWLLLPAAIAIVAAIVGGLATARLAGRSRPTSPASSPPSSASPTRRSRRTTPRRASTSWA